MRIYADINGEARVVPVFHGHYQEAGLYRISNLTNGRTYIGKTGHFGGRFLGHRKLLRKGEHRNWKLQSDYDTVGGLVFEVLAVIRDAKERHALEVEVIRGLFGEDCYNLVVDCALPRQITEETRGKIRAARALQKPPNLGRKPTEETRRRMSEAKRGKAPPASVQAAALRANLGSKHSDERRAKVAKANTGKTVSLEARAKMRAAKLGRALSEETKAKIAAGNREARRSRTHSYGSVVI